MDKIVSDFFILFRLRASGAAAGIKMRVQEGAASAADSAAADCARRCLQKCVAANAARFYPIILFCKLHVICHH